MAKQKKVEVPNLIVTSRAKQFLSDLGFRCSVDALDQLNSNVAAQLIRAGERCTASKRGTVKPQDL